MPTDKHYPYYQDPNARRDEDDAEGEAAGDAFDEHEDDEDGAFDPLGPDEHDAHLLDEEAREDEIYCPACGELTYDDAPQCANCGHWITDEDTTRINSGNYVLTAVVVALLTIAMLLWMAQF